MFRGINPINLDAKGRLAIPARYRAQINEESAGKLIVTIDPEERCLLLYPLPVWEEIERKIEALPSFNKTTRRIQRMFIGHANEVELDGSGRILLSPPLREYASLQKEVVLLGQGKKFEIWNADSWQKGRESWIGRDIADGGMLPSELQSLSL